MGDQESAAPYPWLVMVFIGHRGHTIYVPDLPFILDLMEKLSTFATAVDQAEEQSEIRQQDELKQQAARSQGAPARSGYPPPRTVRIFS